MNIGLSGQRSRELCLSPYFYVWSLTDYLQFSPHAYYMLFIKSISNENQFICIPIRVLIKKKKKKEKQKLFNQNVKHSIQTHFVSSAASTVQNEYINITMFERCFSINLHGSAVSVNCLKHYHNLLFFFSFLCLFLFYPQTLLLFFIPKITACAVCTSVHRSKFVTYHAEILKTVQLQLRSRLLARNLQQ